LGKGKGWSHDCAVGTGGKCWGDIRIGDRYDWKGPHGKGGLNTAWDWTGRDRLLGSKGEGRIKWVDEGLKGGGLDKRKGKP